jgi:hypothetical protein
MRVKISGDPQTNAMSYEEIALALWDVFRRLPEGVNAISFNAYINFRDKNGRGWNFTTQGEKVELVEYENPKASGIPHPETKDIPIPTPIGLLDQSSPAPETGGPESEASAVKAQSKAILH